MSRCNIAMQKQAHKPLSAFDLRTELTRKWLNQDWTETEELDNCDITCLDNIVVIGGCARSGTTLARVILDSHSNLIIGPPTNVFIPTPVDINDIAFRLTISEKSVARLFAESENRVQFISSLAAEAKTTHRKQRWGEKTARNVLRFEWILKHFPNARLIHVVRDGRDTVCSLRTHRRRHIRDGEITLTNNEMPLEQCLDRWTHSVQAGIALRSDPRYHEIKYEDLVAAPKTCLIDLCSFLELPFEDSMLRFHEFTGPLRTPIRFPQNIEATLPLYSSSVGRWHTDLNHQEKDLIETKMAPLLHQLGYI